MMTQDIQANNQQSDFTENSEKNSGPHLTGRARSLANLRHFRKGQSGNPGGRPKTPITDAYRRVAKKKYPNDPENRTYAQLVAEGQFKAAINGKTEAAREIRESLEGKIPQSTHVSGGVGADGEAGMDCAVAASCSSRLARIASSALRHCSADRPSATAPALYCRTLASDRPGLIDICRLSIAATP